MKYIYTDKELMEIVARQPLPLTARRLERIMNGRIKNRAAHRRLKKLAKDGLLLSRKFRYDVWPNSLLTVYGTGPQMQELDNAWAEERGWQGLAKRESEWYL